MHLHADIAHLEHEGVYLPGEIASLQERFIAWRESLHICRSRCITNACMSPDAYVVML